MLVSVLLSRLYRGVILYYIYYTPVSSASSHRFARHLVHSSVCINQSVMCCPAPECTVFRRNCEGPLCIDCVYWAMSLQVSVPEIVYVHVHRGRSADALILVGQDGVQRPPIHFPKGTVSICYTPRRARQGFVAGRYRCGVDDDDRHQHRHRTGPEWGA
ncbi:Small G protein signaling modulator 2 [Eumeta japonica]|uniref:Small G protein signaling modulator 2 n=1 Tax=Eumeta variegata TaxID=151549 RepID=A0A4C1UM32_EUMVA|nr:Small G protein signaling modulator 2 [Eumeta japonica]